MAACGRHHKRGDTPQTYGRRAGRMVSQMQHAHTPWSHLWAERVCTWAAHIIRDTGGASWGNQILSVRSTTEVDTLRILNHNRPGTRLNPGFTCKRWTETVGTAAQFLEDSISRTSKNYGQYRANFAFSGQRRSKIRSLVDYLKPHLHLF